MEPDGTVSTELRPVDAIRLSWRTVDPAGATTLAALEASGAVGHAGNVLSSDLFYAPDPERGPLDWYAPAVRMGVLAVEMAALASDLKLSIHPHPTLSETICFSAEAFEGTLTDLYLPKKK